jgi:pimeloyl-ACP methyl ester carboxylesterase
MRYLLLPGNPPAVHFYEVWKKEILRQQPGARVTISAYPLLDRHLNSVEAMKSILQVHSRCLQDFQRESGGPVTLIGHSLGGYFALKMLEENSSIVEKAILVHPFLRAPTRRGRMILNSAKTVGSISILKQGLLGSRKVLEKFLKNLSFVSDEELLKTFFIAFHENETIGKDRSPLIIAPEIRAKIRVLYTRGDTWCPPPVIADLNGQVFLKECPEPHDYVVHAQHRESLFSKILELS